MSAAFNSGISLASENVDAASSDTSAHHRTVVKEFFSTGEMEFGAGLYMDWVTFRSVFDAFVRTRTSNVTDAGVSDDVLASLILSHGCLRTTISRVELQYNRLRPTGAYFTVPWVLGCTLTPLRAACQVPPTFSSLSRTRSLVTGIPVTASGVALNTPPLSVPSAIPTSLPSSTATCVPSSTATCVPSTPTALPLVCSITPPASVTTTTPLPLSTITPSPASSMPMPLVPAVAVLPAAASSPPPSSVCSLISTASPTLTPSSSIVTLVEQSNAGTLKKDQVVADRVPTLSRVGDIIIGRTQERKHAVTRSSIDDLGFVSENVAASAPNESPFGGAFATPTVSKTVVRSALVNGPGDMCCLGRAHSYVHPSTNTSPCTKRKAVDVLPVVSEKAFRK